MKPLPCSWRKITPTLLRHFPTLPRSPGLATRTICSSFAAVERLGTHGILETNLELGQFHSLIEWICLLRSRHAIDDSGAAKLFKYVCDRFYAADSSPDYTVASLESARAILEYCKPAEKNTSADEKIRGCLLDSNTRPENRRSIDVQRILDLQKVPSLDSIFAIYDGLTRIKAKSGAELDAIKKSTEGLPLV